MTSLLVLGLVLTAGPGIARVFAGSRTAFSSGPVLADLSAGIVLSLALDEPAGATTFVDTSGQSNHGTCADAACPEAGLPGKYGLAPRFDGTEDRVDTPLNIDQSSGSPGVTMMAWVYPETVRNERNRFHVLSSDDGGFDWSILRRDHAWHVFTGEGDHSTGFGVQYGTWQHLAAVFEPAQGRIRFYKNGREAIVPYLGYDGSDNPIAVGDNPGPWDEHFRGKIDEVRVYDRALSKTEVQSIFEGGGPVDQDVPCDAGALVAAIQQANTSPGPNTLNLAAGCTYATTLPSITGEIIIRGNGAILDGAGGVPVVPIAENGDLALDHLTIRSIREYALDPVQGGGISNAGALSLTRCTVEGIDAGDGGQGAGIYNSGRLYIADSTIARNGGWHVSGGGIYNTGSATMERSTVRDNGVTNTGGGILNRGTFDIVDSTISGNQAKEFSMGMGQGGGIVNGGSLTLTNCTVTNNDADSDGDGLGGGAILRNTIVAQNGTQDCAGAVTSLGYNLDGDGTCGLDQPTDQPNTAALLGPLQDNGGPTWTHALLAGSPAIDRGNCPGASADQRGEPRPVDLPGIPNAGDGCDIGAFEVQAQVGGYLARVIVMNKGGERQAGYRIAFYGGPDGTGQVIATRTTAANGEADVRLPNGQYSYVAQKGCYQSAPVHFWVSGQRVVMTHRTMVRVIVRVVDNAGIGRSGYLVRTYEADGTPQWRQVSTGSGRTRFSMDVLEQHQFTVERSQLQSQPHPIGDGVLCGPLEVRYTLATVEVRVTDAAGQPKGGYELRVYHPGRRYYRVAYTRPNGVATVQLADGTYEYTVRKNGAISAPRGFTVDPPQDGPDGLADDQRIEHVLD